MKMNKLLLLVIGLVILANLASAADVAYVVPSKFAVNNEFIKVLDELQLTRDIILSSNVSNVDFSKYRFILIDDEYFSNAAQIPVNQYPALLVNGRNMAEWGWASAVSKSKSNSPFHINITNTEHDVAGNMKGDIKVYTSKTPILYSLNKYNRYNGIETIASTLYNSEDVVVGIVKAGTTLTKQGNKPTYVNANSVFFGIPETSYWTPETKQLFKNSISWLLNGETYFNIELKEGDNLISLPLILGNGNTAEIFPATASVKKYESGKIISTTSVANNQGYFVKSLNKNTLRIDGKKITGIQNIRLSKGMNLVGVNSLSNINFRTLPTSVSEVSRRKPDGSYEIATRYGNLWQNEFELEPGKGYWIKSEQEAIWSYNPL